MKDYQIPYQIINNPEAMVQYLKSGLLVIKKRGQISDIVYLKFLNSADLTLNSFLDSRE